VTIDDIALGRIVDAPEVIQDLFAGHRSGAGWGIVLLATAWLLLPASSDCRTPKG